MDDETHRHGHFELDGWHIDTDFSRHLFDDEDQWMLSVRVNGTFVGGWRVSGRSSLSSFNPPRVIQFGQMYGVDPPDEA